MLGSILTRQYRFATRGIEIGLRTAHQAVAVAGEIVGDIAGRLGHGNGRGERDVVARDVVPAPPPASTPEPPIAPTRAPEPPPAPTRAPEPPSARAPSHLSTEAVLVEESAEPGAEDGAGAQVRVGEPWPGYRGLKARDVVARLPFATREELAAVELFERAGANRKSVVVAAQRALKKASPPR